IPYTFSDPLSCAITLDKALAKKIVQSAGIPTSNFFVIEKIQDIKKTDLQFPLFIKPIAEGTGKGVDADSLVEKPENLKKTCKYLLEKFKQPLLAEEFLSGREFTVAVLGNASNAKTLGIMEIEIPGDPKGIYSFTAKEKCEQLVNYKPYRDKALYDRLSKLAVESYHALQCRDAARVDFRCDKNGEPNFLEINPLPGLHPTHSDLPMIAAQEGMSYQDLIKSIIDNALARTKRPVD
ncbi:MAG: ATP-grasp domain-containing protein, partial [Phycisphaerae bacterium]